MRLAFAVLCALAWPAATARAQSAPTAAAVRNVLHGARVESTSGATAAERLADGQGVPEGDYWLTTRTARLGDPSASVVWDLGQVEPLRCAFVQGDNNDWYQLDGSSDGRTFAPLWAAGPDAQPGMRTRQGRFDGAARYVRLRASGGDGLYGIAEVVLASDCPDGAVAGFERATGARLEADARSSLTWFALATIGFVAVHGRKRWRRSIVWGIVPLALGLMAASQVWDLAPVLGAAGEDPSLESLLRAIVASITAAIAIKETFASDAAKLPTPVRNGLLAILAVLSLGCYYHFGSAQFVIPRDGRRTYVHTWDMRHYVPQAKYFDELRFDGLYAAEFAAFLDVTGRSFDAVAPKTRFRDLRTSQIRSAVDMRDHIDEVRARFSERRWQSFKDDVRVFIDLMGPDVFLQGMVDHGGNATPVWIFVAHLLTRDMPFTEGRLVALGLIDVALVALLFAVVWRTFGFVVFAYVAILFGATDFYMLGSNLMGSLLRQDWLVAMGLGACAFKRGRHVLGGVLVGYAGLVRAFPAVGAFFLVAPLLWAAVDGWRRDRRVPPVRELIRQQRATVRALIGVAACVAVLTGASVLTFGVRSWGAWRAKIAIHANDPSENNVGLRPLVAYRPTTTTKALAERGVRDVWGVWDREFRRNTARRAPLRNMLVMAFVLALLLAARRQPLERIVLLALTSVPFLFYPSNYYLHLIFLLPIAAAAVVPSRPGDRFAAVALPWTVAMLSLLCAGQYLTLLDRWGDQRFLEQSALLVAAFVAIVAPPAWSAWQDLQPPRAEPAAEA